MFARKRNGDFFAISPSAGSKSAKTLSCVSSVRAVFRSNPYSPTQRKVFPPGTRWRLSILIFRSWNTASSSAVKSSPTTATTETSVKNEAATEKCVAAPPRLRSRVPKGVVIESSATEPTTSSGVGNDIDNLSLLFLALILRFVEPFLRLRFKFAVRIVFDDDRPILPGLLEVPAALIEFAEQEEDTVDPCKSRISIDDLLEAAFDGLVDPFPAGLVIFIMLAFVEIIFGRIQASFTLFFEIQIARRGYRTTPRPLLNKLP